MRNEIEARVQRAIAEKVFPGCVVGVVGKNGREVYPFGRFTYDDDSPRVTEDTVYDLASITKSIPLASLAALFADERKLALDDRVTTYIPELQNDFGATIEDLLRYRVKGVQMSTLRLKTFEEIRTHIFENGFDGPPGESVYTNLPAFLLGIVLERVSGEILPALAHEHLFEPLKMRDTTFFPHDLTRVAPTENVDGNEIRGIVHDESARVFAKARRAVGHAGLFSTTPDLLNFLEKLLQEKYGFTKPIFKPIVEAAEQGLGWQVQSDFLGRSERDLTALKRSRFGKTGFTGTSVFVDRPRNIGVVILSNRTYPMRPSDGSAINSFRADVADVVFRKQE